MSTFQRHMSHSGFLISPQGIEPLDMGTLLIPLEVLRGAIYGRVLVVLEPPVNPEPPEGVVGQDVLESLADTAQGVTDEARLQVAAYF